MRLTCDVNVLVRAAMHPLGLARETVNRSNQPPHVMIVSPPLLDDLERVLHYPHIRSLGLSDEYIADFLTFLRGPSAIIPQPIIVPVVTADPDVDVVVATAVDGKADVICTLDKHFSDPAVVAYCAARNIRILTDIALIQELRSSTP